MPNPCPPGEVPRAAAHLARWTLLLFGALLPACSGTDDDPSPTPTSSPAPACVTGGEQSLDDFAARFECEVYPMLTRSAGGCQGCHASSSERIFKLGADARDSFERLLEGGQLDPHKAHTMLDRVSRTDSLMMPLGGPAWSKGEQALLSRFIYDLDVFRCAQPTDPGRVTLHRLNRAEYNNTVRDLLNDTSRPADAFPMDDRGYGFDNIADVLTLSPLLMEKYEAAAERLAEAALGTRPPVPLAQVEAEAFEHEVGSPYDTGWMLNSEGSIFIPFELAENGRYRFTVRAYQQKAGDEPAQLAVSLDEQLLNTFAVEAESAEPGLYRVETEGVAGSVLLGLAFLNDYWQPLGPPNNKDRNLVIDWISLEGPLNQVAPEGTARELLLCTPTEGQEASCAREILASAGRSFWRRPLEASELDRLVRLVQVALDEGEHFEEGIKLGLRALLLSPHFVYRVELDADPTDLTPHLLNDYELATRLAYFLWSSTPDEVLLSVAAEGRLQDPAELEMQVERMLTDPRAQALVDNFAGQWLYTRSVATASPEPSLFPDFDESLRAAMIQETLLFFRTFLDEDRSLLELVDADDTFLNARLAQHYGIEGDFGEDFVRVKLPRETRGGILSHGSVQVATSYPDRTSPVFRGKFVLEQLLCQPPAPPPANVSTNLEPTGEPTSQREQLEQHRADPTCASCHAYMDPMGFALENYNTVGAWRTVDDYGYPIDASGELPDGRVFDGPFELGALIKADPGFPTCVVQNLFTYAHGRAPTGADRCPLQGLTENFQAEDYRLRRLVMSLVLSDSFRQRRGEKPEEVQP
ncbi:MAG: DUF1592 domain-containing protein [Myxococcota bacterium]